LGFLQTSDNKNLLNFINLLLDNKRIFYINEISEIFDEMKASHNNVRIVEIETSHKLKAAQIESLKLLFKNKYESDIEIEEIVNEQLLAGIKVKIYDEVIDLSLQNRFNQIKQQLII
jgi:F-type H+-transporting ATPase subunit delta